MAIFFPPLESIEFLNQKPTEGELCFLNFLKRTLDDSFEIFFQPHLNGDYPDIVIMKENAGVYIVEVKDWDLDHYELDERKNWYVKVDGKKVEKVSPMNQVFRYKENLYNLHIEGLLEKKIKNPRLLFVVNCGIYFHKASRHAVEGFVRQKFDIDNLKLDRWDRYLKFLSYFDFMGFDSLRPEFFNSIMERRRMRQESTLFDQDLYKSFKRHLKPPTHLEEQGIEIIYSDEQQKVIASRAKDRQKVKGVAGSGKTLCLAKRAVNAHKRHGGKVLILTFNISLRNYIHDKLSDVRETFAWANFHIIHYHEFFKNQANNHSLPIKSLDDWNNQNFFSSAKDSIRPYKTIIIDEVQDYEKEWINLIIKTFLDKEDGEFVVFGDEKQNIYQRVYDRQEKKPYTGIPGAWNLLKRSYRVTNDIAILAQKYQSVFFSNKYELDEILIQRDLFDRSQLLYYFLPVEKADHTLLISLYNRFVNQNQVHDNDVCFQCSRVELLRTLDYAIRGKSVQKTNTMFETEEVHRLLLEKHKLTEREIKGVPALKRATRNHVALSKEKLDLIKRYESFKKDIELIRRNKKFNYWNNRGYLKMSTVHSFKGWEINTLFLIIEREDVFHEDDFNSAEVIYTAITRCRQNLVIVNLNNSHYHNFLVGNLKNVS